jgi:hypothetical protein
MTASMRLRLDKSMESPRVALIEVNTREENQAKHHYGGVAIMKRGFLGIAIRH